MKTKPESLPERLAVEFNQPGKSYVEAAKLCNIDKSTISRQVSGELVPSEEQIEILAEYFGMHHFELQHGKEVYKEASYAYLKKYGKEDSKMDEELAHAYGDAMTRIHSSMIKCRGDKDLFKAILVSDYIKKA